jgi:hypothetical protein
LQRERTKENGIFALKAQKLPFFLLLFPIKKKLIEFLPFPHKLIEVFDELSIVSAAFFPH